MITTTSPNLAPTRTATSQSRQGHRAPARNPFRERSLEGFFVARKLSGTYNPNCGLVGCEL